ncbi:hypothetical protein AXF42_Ash011473 [Apostasia shenzhenica]|uniref:Glabrous enhancer-binding protein-like DBD domain-containing protein n=1 Tax=Apostasia shenzhenica TaxID=1088818 RepID=A0A2I0BAS5_9ASPA|nr:hypothetical protein AXF42_Ash011473 [Apostasia shenzhenica]
MATSTPLNIKSAARKLPIKRRTPAQSLLQPQPLSSPNIPTPHPNPNPNPNPKPNPNHTVLSDPPAYSSFDDDPDAENDEEADADGGRGGTKQPPFKFHRIWSESDEIRFLQGLLGCWSQGLVFPRDLNMFYDRFTESMPQPYTRSQLSEKLRRLRKKYRVMAGRVERGHNASRLSQHDRDLLHLCTRLWDPSYSSTSPFPAHEAAATTISAGNKRRRPNPRPSGRTRASSSVPQPASVELVPHLPSDLAQAVPARAPSAEDVKGHLELLPTPPIEESGFVDVTTSCLPRVEPNQVEAAPKTLNKSVDTKVERTSLLPLKMVLNVFDSALNEMRSTLACQGFTSPDNALSFGSQMNDLSKKWQEQRIAEFDVLARRWRLVIEQATQI